MQFIIDHADYNRLSASTQRDLLSLLDWTEATEHDAVEEVDDDDDDDDDQSWLVDMTPKLFEVFVRGVSSKTNACLRVLAQNDGRATPAQFLAVTPYTDERELTGVQSGITKRTRRLVGEAEVWLMGWRSLGEAWVGEFYVSDVTLASMKAHYGIN